MAIQWKSTLNIIVLCHFWQIKNVAKHIYTLFEKNGNVGAQELHLKWGGVQYDHKNVVGCTHVSREKGVPPLRLFLGPSFITA